MNRLALALAAFCCLPQDDLRKTLQDDVAGDEWIYDDWSAAVAQAKKDGRPIFALVR
jgi:hypothetical protein